MMADILICSENAQFCLPEIKLGLITGTGGAIRLTKAIGKTKAMEMLLSGEPIDAREALRVGLVSRVYPTTDAMKKGCQ